jgi:hypothetical protein
VLLLSFLQCNLGRHVAQSRSCLCSGHCPVFVRKGQVLRDRKKPSPLLAADLRLGYYPH